MMAKSIWGVLLLQLLLLELASANMDEMRIRTSSGVLIGVKKQFFDASVKLFLGVPYAEPPTGEKRFRAPIPYERPDEIIETKKFAPVCIQPPHIRSAISPLLKFNQTTISEDCLYLNLYVPDLRDAENLPVIVFLTGEGFSYADPSQFDGSYLAVYGKVIVATVHYRVSVFGFLSALNEDAPGNAGLWDQRLALRWIKNNIAAFGGNPEKVTLAGRFTGAMSAVIHALSPLSHNEVLFQRVILHSGVPHSKWIFDETPLNSLTELAEKAGCVYDNLNLTIACLKDLSAQALLQASFSVQNPWRPSLDFNLINEISIDKLTSQDHAPVDVLIFTNKDEGSLCLTALKVLNPGLYNQLLEDKLSEDNFDELITSLMNDVFKQTNSFVNSLIKFKYSHDNLKSDYVEFCGDLYITALSGKLANLLADKHSNLYMGELTHRPSFSNQPRFLQAAHGDSVLYGLGLPLELEDLSETEDALTKRILGVVSNFAYNGNPNAVNETNWPVYSSDTKLVMRFDAHPGPDDVAKTTHEDAVQFWGSIIPEAFEDICPPAPMTSALTKFDEKHHGPSHVTFLGTWVSVPAAEYIMTGLFCLSGILLVSLFISLCIIYRHTSSMTFHRLK